MPHSSLQQYGPLVECSPIAMVLYDRDMRIAHLNDEFVRLSRLGAQARGKVLYDLAPATRARRQVHQAVLSGGSVDDIDVPHHFPGEPRPRYSDIRYRPLRDEQGSVIGILSTIVDVTEQVHIRQELQDLLGYKDDFLDLSAHELRTPITVIKAFAQLAQRPKFRDNLPWLMHAFEVISRHSDHLSHLVNDMIEASRIGSMPLPLYNEQFDLRDLITDLQSEYAPVFRRCSCSFNLPNTPIILEADRNRIGTVLSNIIDNADKYRNQSELCRIEIAAEQNGRQVVITIRDNGIGIPPDEQDKVFDRFFRASNTGTRSRNGLGLGLYICRTIVEQHGGRIWLESASDAGTTFYFALPTTAVKNQR